MTEICACIARGEPCVTMKHFPKTRMDGGGQVMASKGGSIRQPQAQFVCIQTAIKRHRESSDA